MLAEVWTFVPVIFLLAFSPPSSPSALWIPLFPMLCGWLVCRLCQDLSQRSYFTKIPTFSWLEVGISFSRWDRNLSHSLPAHLAAFLHLALCALAFSASFSKKHAMNTLTALWAKRASDQETVSDCSGQKYKVAWRDIRQSYPFLVFITPLIIQLEFVSTPYLP